MGIVEKVYEKVFAELDIYHVIRLVVIVGGYLIFRTRAQEWLKTRQLKAQLEDDRAKRAESLVERPEDELETLQEQTGGEYDDVAMQDRSWGWGKQTRTRARKLQRKFEETVEAAAVKAQRAKENGYDSDDDIKEFLQD